MQPLQQEVCEVLEEYFPGGVVVSLTDLAIKGGICRLIYPEDGYTCGYDSPPRLVSSSS